MEMTTREYIAILQKENSNLKEDNNKMKETLEFVNGNLSALFHDLDKGKSVNVKEVVRYVGSNVESLLNDLK